METLQISKENALKAYEEAGDKTKKVLSNLFGAKTFLKNATERIKSYEDACEDQGIEPLELSDFDFLPVADRKHAFASHKLTVIIKALNEGWVPDWKNGSQYKYYGWFKQVGSGAGFSYDDYVYGYSVTTVGSRLCFKSRELAEYAGKQFINEYNDYLTL
ncbi:MAG: hypothetical protein WBP45_11145 [Daejeonella sp.]